MDPASTSLLVRLILLVILVGTVGVLIRRARKRLAPPRPVSAAPPAPAPAHPRRATFGAARARTGGRTDLGGRTD